MWAGGSKVTLSMVCPGVSRRGRQMWWVVTWYTLSCHTFDFASLPQRNQEEKGRKGESCGGYKGKVGRGVVRVGVMAGILRKTDPLSL